MKVTILQTDIAWAAPLENMQAAEKLIDQNPGSDLYVLPEMFTTGFATQPEGIADASGEALRWMKEMAHRTDAAICGSVAVDDCGKYYNRLFFVRPDGTFDYYDKRHLFSYGGENVHYTHGEKRKVACWRGVRIMLCVCYDLRFPVWSRYTDALPYDMIIYVANWPDSRRRVWDTLLTARALENQCYVAGVNRVGSDPACQYDGGSCLIDAYGRVVTSCHDNTACAATATLDMQRLAQFRQKFPVLADTDQ